jgi:hypothetical protein
MDVVVVLLGIYPLLPVAVPVLVGTQVGPANLQRDVPNVFGVCHEPA